MKHNLLQRDEALNKTIELIILYIVGFCFRINIAIIFPIIPLYAEKLGASPVGIGAVVGAASLASAVAMIGFGMLSDKIGKRWLLILGLLFSSLAPLFYVVAKNVIWLFWVRAFHGISMALFIPVAFALVADLSKITKRGESFGWYSFFSVLGLAIGAIVGGIIVERWGFDVAFYACSIAAGVAFVIIVIGFLGYKEHNRNLTSPTEYWSWLKNLSTISVFIVRVVSAYGFGGFIAFVPIYAQELGVTEARIGMLIGIMLFISAVFRVPFGKLSDRIGRKPVVVGGLIFGALALAAIPFCQTYTHLILMVIGLSFNYSLSTPAAFALLADISPYRSRGVVMGTNTSAAAAGRTIGAVVTGFIVGKVGFSVGFWVCGAVVALGTIIFLLMSGYRQAKIISINNIDNSGVN